MGNETIRLGMGCFWGPEAWIGAMEGVVGTMAGLAGGQSEDPGYRQPADHSETVQVVYDEAVLLLEQLLEQFWQRHRPAAINGYRAEPRYRSLILCTNEPQLQVAQQLQQADEARKETIIRLDTTFYPVDERHQKYYLQRQPDVLEQLVELYEATVSDWDVKALDTTLAARLNGWTRQQTTVERIRAELPSWPEPLEPLMQQRYEQLLDTMIDRSVANEN
ncbi:peptide-methionine (S)-S-oxide reductase [Paenibacillus hunanensis]|uniref:peptide-methionine (S)-S-oxide reductase n=1 Tax=Paenibacillus hunanensis TaxID=539262 RepID=UPI002A6B53E6|nr:peptide-methionine (S)-S-oxide reductase [Paenibacillus hunanensis]WPP41567.1 peptide-methionine (S)-S-oxide reductase [Paenibacillus hunanensis]